MSRLDKQYFKKFGLDSSLTVGDNVTQMQAQKQRIPYEALKVLTESINNSTI